MAAVELDLREAAPRSHLLGRIREAFAQLSPAHQTVARALLEHPDEVAFATAAALAQRLGVSESTIVRFAMALGYTGYPEMQVDAQAIVRRKLSTVNRLMGSEAAQLSGESVSRKVMLVELENVRLTLEQQSDAVLNEVADAILAARQVHVAGFRSLHSLALLFSYALSLVRPKAHVVDCGLPLEQLQDLGPDDLVIGITFKRYTARTVEVLHFAHQLGARTLAITDTPLSPLAGFADWTLYARNELPSFVDSFVAPLSLIDALVTMVGLKAGKASLDRLQRMETIWEQYGVFVQDPLGPTDGSSDPAKEGRRR